MRLADLDFVFLSYDEPNCEENYNDLLKHIPWAKRVHGVSGSDSAHKACAELSETERLVIINGDNKIDQELLHQQIYYDGDDWNSCVFSWPSRNFTNGLIYGNGGVKCWPKELLLNMRTHENADPENIQAQVDFCWDIKYVPQKDIMATVHNNASAKQAWRAGFREGVKMCLDNGVKHTEESLMNGHWKNLHRLYIWQMIGADVKNGLWAVYGARQGFYKTMFTDWNFIEVRDFNLLDSLWNEIECDFDAAAGLYEDISSLGTMIHNNFKNYPIADSPLDRDQSRWFKEIYLNPSRYDNTFIR